MNDVSYQTIQEEEAGQRLDNYLIRILKGVPKSHIYRIIRSGEVRVNKGRARVSSRLQAGDSVRIPPIRLSQEKTIFVSKKIEDSLNDSIIYEDNHLMVLNKPAGIAVHGGSGQQFGVIEALRKSRPELHYLELIHRLDKDTSGCLLIAKKRSALRAIHAELASRKVQKTYWALCLNDWQDKKNKEVCVALQKNLLRSGERIVKVHPEGKESNTFFRLLENFSNACWLEAKPVTGRTHQIRVHSAHIGHVILGDKKYGFDADVSTLPDVVSERLYLHAREIQFSLNDKLYQFEAAIDDVFKSTIEQLRNRSLNNHV